MITLIRRSRLLQRAFLILAFLHVVWQAFVFLPREMIRDDRERDVVVYHTAARSARAGQSIYRIQENYGPNQHPEAVYIYPPPLAALLTPFANWPFPFFARAWMLSLFVGFWLYAGSLAQLSRSHQNGQPFIFSVLTWGLALALCPGSYRALALGQIDPLLWMCCGLGMAGVLRPALWSAAALVKVFYLWPLIVWGTQRGNVQSYGKAMWPALAVVTASILLGAVVCGPESYAIWARDVLPTLSQGNFNPDNVSFSMAILRVARYSGWQYIGGPLPPLAHGMLLFFSVAGPLLGWFLTRHKRLEVQCACVITTAILWAPVCWTAYLPLCLMPWALWLGNSNGVEPHLRIFE